MYAIKITTVKRGAVRKTTRWAEKIGEEWYMVLRLASIIYNRSAYLLVSGSLF